MSCSDSSSQSSDLKHDLSEIKASLLQVVSMLAVVRDSNAALAVTHAALNTRVEQLESHVAITDPSNSRRSWVCPVCAKLFKHRESFKGHILRLKDPQSERSRCRLDPDRPDHIVLLSHPRYGHGDFPSRACSFAQQFYDTVRSNSTSTRTSESSHSAVSLDMFIFCNESCYPSSRYVLGLKKVLLLPVLRSMMGSVQHLDSAI
jgi:hypothetical protein